MTKENLNITQLVKQGEMLEPENFGVTMLAAIGRELYYSGCINRKGFSELLPKARVYHIATIRHTGGGKSSQDFDVHETFTVWNEWCHEDDDGSHYAAVRISDGLLTPEECLHTGWQMLEFTRDVEDARGVSDNDEACIAVAMFEQILNHVCVRGTSAIDDVAAYGEVQMFRVTNPIPTEKFVWSKYEI